MGTLNLDTPTGNAGNGTLRLVEISREAQTMARSLVPFFCR